MVIEGVVNDKLLLNETPPVGFANQFNVLVDETAESVKVPDPQRPAGLEAVIVGSWVIVTNISLLAEQPVAEMVSVSV